MQPMNPVALGMWTGALESDRYSKGIGYMCRRTNIEPGQYFGTAFLTETPRILHCPLGVLCEQGVKCGVIPPGRWNSKNAFAFKSFKGEWGNLPPDVFEWAGFDTGNPKVLITVAQAALIGLKNVLVDQVQSITNLSDHRGLSFKQIAILLRSTYGAVAPAT